MTNGLNRQKDEYPSTYVVLDRHSIEELDRLFIQDGMLTAAMGGVWPEQPPGTAFQRVLDIGCGTGNWIIEAAKTYPSLEKLIGVDVNKPMIEYAREQAQIQGVADRVEFLVMDALLILELPYNFFDLVNMRLAVSFLRTWDWPKVLSEMQRVCRPGGIIRITDIEILQPNSTSFALQQHFIWWMQALFRAGHLFEEQTDGLTAHLPALLTRHGVQQVQTNAYPLQFQAGTPQGQAYFEDLRRAFHTGRPFLERRGCLPKDYESIYQQAILEMQQPDFCTTWNFFTAWGRKTNRSPEKARD